MPGTITVREANQQVARVVRDVEAGKEFVVTRNGVPIARISPERAADGTRRLTPIKEHAQADSLAWLRPGWSVGIGHVERDDLHDDPCEGYGGA